MDRSSVVAVLACALAVFSPQARAQVGALPPDGTSVEDVITHGGRCQEYLIGIQCHDITTQSTCLVAVAGDCLT